MWRCIVVFTFLVSLAATAVLPRSASALEIIAGAGNNAIISGGTHLDLTAGANTSLLFDWFQVGGSINFQTKSHKSNSVGSFLLMGGPTINFGDPKDSIFVNLAALIRSGSADPEAASSDSSSSSDDTEDSSGESDPTGSGFGLFIGKRFDLGLVSLRPNIGVVSIDGIGFMLNLVQVSLFF